MQKKNKVSGQIAFVASVGAAALISAAAGSASAQTYTVTNIGPMIAGNNYGSVPTGINSSDQVVGYYNAGAPNKTNELPFVYTPGSGAVTIPNVSAYFQTQASAINNAGIVVGDGLVSGDGSPIAQEGFVYNVSTNTTTGVAPVAAYSGYSDVPSINLASINNSGIAVGYSYVNSSYQTYRPVTYNVSLGGTPTNIGTNFSGPVGVTGSSSNYGWSINDSGVIAGVGPNTGGAYKTGPTDFYTVTAPYATANFTDISTLLSKNASFNYSSALASEPTSVDASGNVAGTYVTTNGSSSFTGFLYLASSGSVVEIPGNGITIVEGIADVGNMIDVVGTTNNQSDAFLYTYSTATNSGTFTDETSLIPGDTFSAFTAINSNGDITATGTNGSGYSQAFLLQAPPTPEPASLGLLALGGLAMLRKRRSPSSR